MAFSHCYTSLESLLKAKWRMIPLWYAGPNAVSNAISFAKFNSRSHNAAIRVFDETGNVIAAACLAVPQLY
jgi:hypothetical protein